MRIFLDENLSEYVADALNSLNRGYFPNIEVVSTRKAIGVGRPDEEVIPLVGQEQGILITRDYDIKRTRAQFDLCKGHGLGVIFIRLPKNENRHWELVRLLVKFWEEIIALCTRKRPFSYRLGPRSGLTPLP